MNTAKTLILSVIVTLFLAIPCFGGDANQKADPADATDEKPAVAASDAGDGGTVVGEDDDPLSFLDDDIEKGLKEAKEELIRSEEELIRSEEELIRSEEELRESEEALKALKTITGEP